MSVLSNKIQQEQYQKGETLVGQDFTIPKGSVAIEIRIDRNTALAQDIWTDQKEIKVTLLRSKDGKEWENAGGFTAQGGAQKLENGQDAEVTAFAFRNREDGYTYRIKIDSPEAQKIPVTLYTYTEYEGFAAPLAKSSNSVGYVDNEAYVASSVASFEMTNNLTITGSDVAVYVGIAGRRVFSPYDVSSCKWGGSGGTEMTEVADTGHSIGVRAHQFRILDADISGDAKVYATFSAQVEYLFAEATSWNTVDQTTPELDTYATIANHNGEAYPDLAAVSMSDTMTTASGNKVFGVCLGYNGSGYTGAVSATGTASTGISAGNNSNRFYKSAYWSPTGATHSVGFSVNCGYTYGYATTALAGAFVSIKEATGGGGTEANSSRAAETHGQAGANAVRSAEITGTATANATRAAEVSGAQGSTSERSAEIHGVAVTNSERAAEVTGVQVATSERVAEVHGVATTSSTRAAEVTGGGQANAERAAEVAGTATASSTRQAEITGEATASSTRAAETTGVQSATDERDAEVSGQASANSTRAAEVSGVATTTNTRAAEVTGVYSWQVQRKVDGGEWEDVEIEVQIEEDGGNYVYEDDDVTAGHTYCYRVRNVPDDSEYSPVSCVTFTGTGVADEKDAEVHGEATTSSERAAEVSGTAAATSERDAEVAGQATATSERGAEIHGTADTSDTRGAETTGQQSATSERSAEITGTASANDTRDAEVHGEADVSSERGAEVSGVILSTSTRPAEVSGVATATAERGAEITGQAQANADRDAEVHGSAEANDTRGAEVTGENAPGNVTDERAAEVHGTATATAERGAETHGQNAANASRAAEVTGVEGETSERGAEVHGTDTENDQRNAEVTGSQSANAERGAEVSGTALTTSERSAEVHGTQSTSNTRGAEVTGGVISTAERSAEVSGIATTSAERVAEVRGSQSATAERGAEITGIPPVISTSSSRSAEVRGFGVAPYCPDGSPYEDMDSPYISQGEIYTPYGDAECEV